MSASEDGNAACYVCSFYCAPKKFIVDQVEELV